MTSAQDFVICEVFDETSAECIDRAPVSRWVYGPR